MVIGGGAAGIFGAVRCKSANCAAKVILLEKTNQLLTKVKISGGGRCNVTHACFDPKKLAQNYPRGSKELLSPFHRFQPKDTITWFEERGVPLKKEDDGRMFPTTDSSATVTQCLLNAASSAGVEIRTVQHIQAVERVGPSFLITLHDDRLYARSLLLATGSAPWGHKIAQMFGHNIIPPVPSLFTFNVPSSSLLDLAGISVPKAVVTLENTPFRVQGPLLLTHWGFSGPSVLKLSALAARTLHECNYQATVVINWIEGENREGFYNNLLERKKRRPEETFPPLLPHNLQTRLLTAVRIDPKTPFGSLSHADLGKVASKLTSDRYIIEGKTTYKHEFVTAGGVDLREIDFKRMESRITPNLFFAGEILDIDGVTGGFNFQNAWTTAWIAGEAAATPAS